MARDRFVSPRKGTKVRALINLLLKPQGMTTFEAVQAGLVKESTSISGVLARLEYECGFDIRVVGASPRVLKGRRAYIYRIVGRHRWNGQYRSFVNHMDKAA